MKAPAFFPGNDYWDRWAETIENRATYFTISFFMLDWLREVIDTK